MNKGGNSPTVTPPCAVAIDGLLGFQLGSVATMSCLCRLRGGSRTSHHMYVQYILYVQTCTYSNAVQHRPHCIDCVALQAGQA